MLTLDLSVGSGTGRWQSRDEMSDANTPTFYSDLNRSVSNSDDSSFPTRARRANLVSSYSITSTKYSF